jgi:hypothetical protein
VNRRIRNGSNAARSILRVKAKIMIGFSRSIPCPNCGSIFSSVIDSRNIRESRRRRRQCQNGHRFTTYEHEENWVCVHSPELAEDLAGIAVLLEHARTLL